MYRMCSSSKVYSSSSSSSSSSSKENKERQEENKEWRDKARRVVARR